MMSPNKPVIRLNLYDALAKKDNPPDKGKWLLSIDPETLEGRIVIQEPGGYVPEIEGHEDLFPLSMLFERMAGYLEGGDSLVAITPDKREHDGIYRSYLVEWEVPNNR